MFYFIDGVAAEAVIFRRRCRFNRHGRVRLVQIRKGFGQYRRSLGSRRLSGGRPRAETKHRRNLEAVLIGAGRSQVECVQLGARRIVRIAGRGGNRRGERRNIGNRVRCGRHNRRPGSGRLGLFGEFRRNQIGDAVMLGRIGGFSGRRRTVPRLAGCVDTEIEVEWLGRRFRRFFRRFLGRGSSRHNCGLPGGQGRGVVEIETRRRRSIAARNTHRESRRGSLRRAVAFRILGHEPGQFGNQIVCGVGLSGHRLRFR